MKSRPLWSRPRRSSWISARRFIFCVIASGWVQVNNDITAYLPDSTETRQGLTIMDEEFTTFGTNDIPVDNITYAQAESLAHKIETVRGVKSVAFDDSEDHYKDASALFSVTYDGETEDSIRTDALNNLSLTGTDLTEDSVTPLRILCPGSGTLWHYGDEGWTQVSTHRSGSYLLTEMHGVSGVFCAVPSDSWLTAILSVCGILTALVVLAVILLRRKRKKRLNSAANASVLKNNPGKKASANASKEASANELGKAEIRNKKKE